MGKFTSNEIEKNLNCLKILSNQYPSIATVGSEIINLYAMLNLPKGTEHFLSDIHGEYEAFSHVLRNASGVLKLKIGDIFGDSISESEKKSLATLMYYPEQKLDIVKNTEANLKQWYTVTLRRLIEICRVVSSKYTRNYVRKAMPKDFSYIIEELLHEDENRLNKHNYFNNIIETIISIDRADVVITAICKLIQRLSIARLHVIGDIYDRGPGSHIIMDELMDYHSVDIQWGNHDILWMGAAAGCEACIANVIRVSCRYANLSILEEGYGINLLPLATLALEYYKEDTCKQFETKLPIDLQYGERDLDLITKMHKAISIIQFKVEGQIIKNNPGYEMDNRLLLDKIDYDKGTININNEIYELNDTNFPTIDTKNPYKLTEEESSVLETLRINFVKSKKFQEHIKFLFSKGSFYLKYNSNLLYHACIPMEKDGSFTKVKILDKEYSGKEYLDKLNEIVREAYYYYNNLNKRNNSVDIFWYLWCGEKSPLFGKDVMATFERYFIDDKSTHKENKNPYFEHIKNEDICNKIFKEFDLDTEVSHIVNGHMPVKAVKGESPIKANGKLIVIDGGFSKAYQPATGIAGYTLIYNSYGYRLASHEPYESTEIAIKEGKDILSTMVVLEAVDRKYVKDTDQGKEIMEQIKYLEMLLAAYRKGYIKQRN